MGSSADTTDPSHFELKIWWFSVAHYISTPPYCLRTVLLCSSECPHSPTRVTTPRLQTSEPLVEGTWSFPKLQKPLRKLLWEKKQVMSSNTHTSKCLKTEIRLAIVPEPRDTETPNINSECNRLVVLTVDPAHFQSHAFSTTVPQNTWSHIIGDLFYCRAVINLLSRPLIAEFLPDRLMPGLRGSASLSVAARGLRWPGGTKQTGRRW